MNRRCLVALALLAAALTGCVHDGSFSIAEAFGGKEPSPRAPKMTPATLHSAERVESLGRRIMVQNTFPGIDPLFHTVGVEKLMLFHRGSAELFISEGLVARCKTDEELAAVLCSELGQMKAEKQAAVRVGRDKEAFPEVGAADAPRDQKPSSPTAEVTDARKSARDLMVGAGFDPAAIDRAEPLLKAGRKNDGLRKQMAGSATAPAWEK